MFDATGDRAVHRGLRLAMFALLAIVAVRLVRFAGYWLAGREIVSYDVIDWFSSLLLTPVSILACGAIAAGMWLCFKGALYPWAKRLAVATMAIYALAAIFKLLGLGLSFLPDSIRPELYPGNVGEGLVIAGAGVILYFMMANDAEDFGRGRGQILPAFPIIIGAVVALGGAIYDFSWINLVVIVASAVAACAIYNSVPEEMPEEPKQGP